MQAVTYMNDPLPRIVIVVGVWAGLSDVAEPDAEDGKVKLDRRLLQAPLSDVGPSITNSFYQTPRETPSRRCTGPIEIIRNLFELITTKSHQARRTKRR
jgi:hypothetical protein